LQDHGLREALAIVFAGGLEGAADKGMAIYQQMMRDVLADYCFSCDWLGVARKSARMPQALTQYMPLPEQQSSGS